MKCKVMQGAKCGRDSLMDSARVRLYVGMRIVCARIGQWAHLHVNVGTHGTRMHGAARLCHATRSQEQRQPRPICVANEEGEVAPWRVVCQGARQP